MEQITKRDGFIYYGSKKCSTPNEAYLRFRKDYHESLGKVSYKRLNRLGSRTERVHGYGFVFDGGRDPGTSGYGKVPVRILGIISGAYCRMLDGSYIPDGTDEEIGRWIDEVFREGSGLLRLVGKNRKYGRTSKRLNTRYR